MSTANVGTRLKGRRMLITGAASGIGLETARRFLSEGAKVGIIDLDAQALDAVAKELGVPSAQADVSDPASVHAAVNNCVEQLGGLDGLVNCAGIFIPSRAEDGDYVGWTKTIAVNLNGPFLVTAAALPHLKRAATATIVNVASGIALRPSPAQGAYAASKAGLLAWTKVLAQELGPRIRANATCPGPTDTPLMRAHTGNMDLQTFSAERALQRAGQASEQADAILFLSGPESSFITGIAIAVDGGRAYH